MRVNEYIINLSLSYVHERHASTVQAKSKLYFVLFLFHVASLISFKNEHLMLFICLSKVCILYIYMFSVMMSKMMMVADVIHLFIVLLTFFAL